MPLHVRVELPDRPGSLASVARTVAAAGGDIRSIHVLDAEEGRAVDELLIDWPAHRRVDLLRDALHRCQGVTVLGMRIVTARAETHDVDVVLQLLANPSRAYRTLVDALPGLMLADWAALLRRSGHVQVTAYASVGAPESVPTIEAAPRRPHLRSDGASSSVVVPCEELAIVVGRHEAPAFVPAELSRTVALAAVAAKVAAGASLDVAVAG